MASPPLTVAMSVYNDGKYVGAAIDSILSQTFADFELLVIDDRSTDDSAQVIAAKATADSRIRVLPSPEKGRVPALNALFAAAQAPWVAIMDSDDVSMPDRLEKQMAHAAANPACGVIGCSAFLIGPDGARLGEGGDKPLTHDAIYANLEDKPLINHNAVLIARDPVLEIGGYRRAYRHAEDYDLWLQLIDRVEFANLPDKLVAYRVYPDQVSTRHIVEQTLNAAIAWQARCEVLAGRADPTCGLDEMPPLDEIDALFGRVGVAAYARRRVIERALYMPEALAGDGYEILLDHIAENGPDAAYWRAAGRLLKSGRPWRAASVAGALLKAG